jgi:AcrR family transcriptional regulator
MPSAKRRRLQPEARRHEIICAAERLLKVHDGAVRVDDVVREAGAAKGTFYLYFPTWDDLLKTLRRRIFLAFERAHPIPQHPDPSLDWLGAVDELAEAFVDAVGELGGLHEAVFHSDFAQRRPIPAAEHPINRLAALIRLGQNIAAFAEVDPEPTARLLFAVIHETADAVAGGEDRERALAAMHHVLRRMLEPGGPRQGATAPGAIVEE